MSQNIFMFMRIIFNTGTVVTPALTAQCQPWEKSSRGKCVCRFPYECMCVKSFTITNQTFVSDTFSIMQHRLIGWPQHTCTLRPSLEVCAALSRRGPVLLSVCKLHALQCLGKNHTLMENSFCEWPVRDTADACGSCSIWEACYGKSHF